MDEMLAAFRRAQFPCSPFPLQLATLTEQEAPPCSSDKPPPFLEMLCHVQQLLSDFSRHREGPVGELCLLPV